MNEELKPDVQAMEQEVRRRWEHVKCVKPQLVEPREEYWWVELGSFEPSVERGYVVRHTIDGEGETGPIAAWSAAYAFTLAHAQEIAELREEIELGKMHLKLGYGFTEERRRAGDRILARLESALQELLKGWREA